MGKAKRRSFNQGKNDRFKYMTRESALETVIKNIEKKDEVIDTITLFVSAQKKCLKQEQLTKTLWRSEELSANAK